MSKEEKKNAAMDELFVGLTVPSAPTNQQEKEKTSDAVAIPAKNDQQEKEKTSENESVPVKKKNKEEDVRICTIMEMEIMNKLRYISEKESVALRDLFGTAAKMLIKAYEQNNGEIRARKYKPKKGDVNKLFNI